MKTLLITTTILMSLTVTNSYSSENCEVAGPQTPRDITSKIGNNNKEFPWASDYKDMNLCNIHTHTNAEHKGPDFNIFVGDDVNGGYACNETESLSAEQLVDPTNGNGAYKGVKPGDTIEVHWVYSSCDVKPGKGLESCLADDCEDPKLRVESQVFLLVNDEYALNFEDYVYDNNIVNGYHQAKSLPTDTGKPITFRGSTTGPSYTEEKCSPVKVTWSLRPQCAKLDISSLHRWAEKGNVFEESHSHGVRKLVTNPDLLSPISQ